MRRCFENVGLVLKKAGMGYRNVVSVQIYLTDMALFATMNEIYREYLKDPLPARTALVFSLDAGMEVGVIAKKK